MTRPPATYGNDQPWPDADTEPPAPTPACQHPETRTVQTGGYWRKQYGYIPSRIGEQCVTCGEVVSP